MHLTLIKLFLTLANALLQDARERRLFNAGVDSANLKGLQDVINKINLANDAIANVDSLPISQDPANRANLRQIRALPSANDTDV
jgi:hypothetical protein